jgi:hypothetical protein
VRIASVDLFGLRKMTLHDSFKTLDSGNPLPRHRWEFDRRDENAVVRLKKHKGHCFAEQ